MSEILDFFDAIWEGLCNVFDFIAWLVESIGEALSMCFDSLTAVGHYTAFLPATLATCCVAVCTIAIIFKVKG